MILSGCSGHHLGSSCIIPRSRKTLGGEEALTVVLFWFLFSECENFFFLGGGGAAELGVNQ